MSINEAFCVTLIIAFAHFLWQAVVVLVIFEFANVMMRKASANIGYGWGLITMFALALLLLVAVLLAQGKARLTWPKLPGRDLFGKLLRWLSSAWSRSLRNRSNDWM